MTAKILERRRAKIGKAWAERKPGETKDDFSIRLSRRMGCSIWTIRRDLRALEATETSPETEGTAEQ